jgi:nicotinamidase-related amidase
MNTNSAGLLCRADDSQLVVVDVQERLAGAMPPEDLEAVVGNLRILLTAAGRLGLPVTLTEQYPKGLGPTLAGVTEALPAGAKSVEKTAFSCCRAEGFDDALAAARRPRVILAGMEAHVCVLQTAMDLRSRGHGVCVVEDAVCSRHPRNRANAIARLRQAGVWMVSTESVVFEWLQDASNPHFKSLSRLIR